MAGEVRKEMGFGDGPGKGGGGRGTTGGTTGSGKSGPDPFSRVKEEIKVEGQDRPEEKIWTSSSRPNTPSPSTKTIS